MDKLIERIAIALMGDFYTFANEKSQLETRTRAGNILGSILETHDVVPRDEPIGEAGKNFLVVHEINVAVAKNRKGYVATNSFCDTKVFGKSEQEALLNAKKLVENAINRKD
jgi:hypothetical protein